jgi:hypothetical protein
MSISIDDLAANADFTTGGKSKTGSVTFLPEPERRARRYTLISADDHIVEPPDTFEGRVPAALAERAPKIVEKPDGAEVWVYDPAKQARVARIALREWGLSFAVSRGSEPKLLVTNPVDMSLELYDALSGEFLKTITGLGQNTPLMSFGAR